MKVYIVGGDAMIERMFLSRGWDIAEGLTDADLVCFTGGSDVSPSLYGEANVASNCDWQRDVYEMSVWKDASAMCSQCPIGSEGCGEYDLCCKGDCWEPLPMVGICRGGQFLNVMNGGKMWQDVNKHGIWGTHDINANYDHYQVTSTHHQMMIAAPEGEVIGTSFLADHFYGDPNHPKEKPNFDTEIVWYSSTRTLCFQPHPEYNGKEDDTEELFFDLLKQYLGM